MDRLSLSHGWLDRLLPEGIPYPSATVISGPGGSGKPLIGLAIARDWLRAGGSIVFMPLEHSNLAFIAKSFEKLYDLNVEDYAGKTAYIEFDPEIGGLEKTGDGALKANLVKPEVWDKIIGEANELVEESPIGIMFFGSALNLLLFSPTYGDKVLEKLVSIIKEHGKNSYLFTVSTSAYREKIRRLEQASENLMFTRMEKPMELYLRIDRMVGVRFLEEEVKVPIPREMLNEIKATADKTRKRAIPRISRI